jgi:excisionase family DNA binding protein
VERSLRDARLRVTPGRIELPTYGLGIGPPAMSKESQDVSVGFFTLTAPCDNVSGELTQRTESLPHVPTLVPAPLLTLDQVAAMLAVGRVLVERLIGEGALRAIRIGPETRIRPEALQAFLEAAER